MQLVKSEKSFDITLYENIYFIIIKRYYISYIIIKKYNL